jgi:DNA-binding transcriptional LysR family regulator
VDGISLCRAAGFKPRFIAMPDSIPHVLSAVASESVVTLVPDYFMATSHPGIRFVTVSDPKASWGFIVLWQKGKVSAATWALLDVFKETAVRLSRDV